MLYIRLMSVYVCVHACVCMCIYMSTWEFVYMCACTCVCVCLFGHTCVYVHVYVRIHVCTCVCMYVHMYIYIYVRMCMCVIHHCNIIGTMGIVITGITRCHCNYWNYQFPLYLNMEWQTIVGTYVAWTLGEKYTPVYF